MIPPLARAFSDSERDAMLFKSVTMAEIRDAAEWLGVSFAEAYAIRAEVWRRRYYFLR